MREQSKKLLVIGSSNIDHIIRLPAFPKPGETLAGKDYQTVFGGKGANQAVAAARLGACTSFMSCLGDDTLGQSLLKSLKNDNIDVSNIHVTNGAQTGVALIWLASSGENSIAIDAGANSGLTSSFVEKNKSAIVDADVILIQLETPQTGIEKAIKIAHQQGKLVVLNPAPACSLADDVLAHVDIITPNETETEALTGIVVSSDTTAQQAADILHQKGIKQVFITRGAHGVYYSEHGEGRNHKGFSVTAIDTTAAGDTFNGGLVTALLEGQAIEDAIRFAQAASALSVQTIGAQTSVPTRDSVLEFLAKQSK